MIRVTTLAKKSKKSAFNFETFLKWSQKFCTYHAGDLSLALLAVHYIITHNLPPSK